MNPTTPTTSPTPSTTSSAADSDPIVPIAMRRENLDGIPLCPLPAPYALRWYEPGDEQAWTDIWRRSDRINVITEELFADQFGSDPLEIHRRQVYVREADGAAIGTATAWLSDEAHPPTFGRVHWVAIAPEAQGRGLAKPLTSAVLHRMRELGCTGSFLTTESPRLVAIRLYLWFGFLPEVRSPREREAWLTIRDRLAPSSLNAVLL